MTPICARCLHPDVLHSPDPTHDVRRTDRPVTLRCVGYSSHSLIGIAAPCQCDALVLEGVYR